jgi:hypothetical protein
LFSISIRVVFVEPRIEPPLTREQLLHQPALLGSKRIEKPIFSAFDVNFGHNQPRHHWGPL